MFNLSKRSALVNNFKCSSYCGTQSQIFVFFSLIQLLVQKEADLFVENENRETPCDCAEKQHHKDLALRLESQMVFSLAPEAESIEAEYAALDRREVQNQTHWVSPLSITRTQINCSFVCIVVLLLPKNYLFVVINAL